MTKLVWTDMLTVICGIPNAGKTTYSQRYDYVIHEDDIQFTDKICEMVSAAGDRDVCVEGVMVLPRRRRRVASAYKGEGKVCIWLDTPLEVCVAREDRNRSTILVRNCYDVFAPPTLDEGWDEIIRIRNDESIHTKRET